MNILDFRLFSGCIPSSAYPAKKKMLLICERDLHLCVNETRQVETTKTRKLYFMLGRHCPIITIKVSLSQPKTKKKRKTIYICFLTKLNLFKKQSDVKIQFNVSPSALRHCFQVPVVSQNFDTLLNGFHTRRHKNINNNNNNNNNDEFI